MISAWRIITVQTHWVFKIIHDKVKVAIPIQIAHRYSKTRSRLGQPPALANILEPKVPKISKCQVSIFLGRRPFFVHIIWKISSVSNRRSSVTIEKIPSHSVSNEEIDIPIIVEIPKLQRPSPVRFGEPCHVGHFHKAP